jgi:hypothetical protein
MGKHTGRVLLESFYSQKRFQLPDKYYAFANGQQERKPIGKKTR